jgi:hypothetical protein
LVANRFGNSQTAAGRDEVTMEIPLVYVLRRGWQGSGAAAWCATCGAGFRMVAAFAAAALTDVHCRTIYRWAETGEIHFSVNDAGSLLVCLNSLYARESCDKPQYQTGEQRLVTLPA